MTFKVEPPSNRNALTDDETARLERLAAQKTLTGFELGEAHALLIRADWATDQRLGDRIRRRQNVKRS